MVLFHYNVRLHGVHMAVEFITRDESYNGHRLLPNGTVIQQARAFVDHLPYNFPAEQYKPYLVKDRYSHRPRYMIDVNITVRADLLVLLGVVTNGGVLTNHEMAEFIYNISIEHDGLEVWLHQDTRDYQGSIVPYTRPS